MERERGEESCWQKCRVGDVQGKGRGKILHGPEKRCLEMVAGVGMIALGRAFYELFNHP